MLTRLYCFQATAQSVQEVREVTRIERIGKISLYDVLNNVL